MAEQRRRGRPRMNPDAVKRCALNVRTTATARFRLEAAAKSNGRSLTQELEFRLERTFALDDMRQIIREELAAVYPGIRKREGDNQIVGDQRGYWNIPFHQIAGAAQVNPHAYFQGLTDPPINPHKDR